MELIHNKTNNISEINNLSDKKSKMKRGQLNMKRKKEIQKQIRQEVILLTPGKEGFPELLQPVPLGSYQDLLLARDRDPWNRVNLRSYYMLDQMNWGYRGQGPWNLSYSILMHYSKLDRKFTEENIKDFLLEVISQIDIDHSAIIPTRLIEHWIAARPNGGEYHFRRI